MDRGLCECYGLTPPAVDGLTLSEIAVLCMRADEKGPPGGMAMGVNEIAAEVSRWAAMSNVERLEDVRRRRDG